MGKVIKILVNTLSVVILTALGLLVIASILLDMPFFQNFVVGKATHILSEKLGTRVEIDRVRLRLISRARIEGLYVEDYHGDTLLYISRLDAGIRDLGLTGGAVSLGDVELQGTRFYMRQVDSATSNLREILLRLKSDKPKEKGGGFTLRAASLKIDDFRYRYRKLSPVPREGVNFQDIDIGRLDLDAQDISVIDDSITIRARHIAVRDKSGFRVDDLSASFLAVSNRGIRLRDLHVATPDSDVKMNYLNLVSQGWKSFGNFIDSVRIEADIVNSKMSYATVAYFAPGLRDWESVYRDLSARVEGTVSDMKGVVNHVRVLDTRLQGVRFDIGGLPDVPATNFNFDIASLNTNAVDALWLMRDITRRELPDKTAGILKKLGDISFSGGFDGRLDRFHADGRLKTSQGDADLDLAFTPQEGGQTGFDGHLDVQALDLGALLESRQLGRASVRGEVRGSLGASMSVDANATLGRLDYNGYTYSGIAMQGQFRNRNFEGRIKSTDPNIAFDFDGLLDFNDSVPRYDFDLRLYNADLHRLNLNRRDSVSLLACRVTARATGNSLDNANGKIVVDDLLYIGPQDSVATGAITLTAVNNDKSKTLSLHSSFAEVQFQSRLGYADLFSYLTGTLRSYIPTLGSDQRTEKTTSPATADANDFYMLTMKVKEANNLAGIFVPGLIIASGTELSFMFNPRAEKLSLMLQSEYLEWKRFFASDLSLNSRNQGDSLSLYVRAADFYASGFYMPDFSVIGGVKDNRVNVTAHFADSVSRITALVGGAAEFLKSETGIPRIRARLHQSYITNKDQTWRLSSGDILYDSTRVEIGRLRIVSSNGELTAGGVMSRSRSDTLHLRLNNFNLQPFTQFTQRMGYTLSGVSNGYADMVAAMQGGQLTSNITFDSLRVNDVAVRPLQFDARWDFQRERARVVLSDRMAADTLVRFFYSPTDKRYMGDVDLRGVDLSLVDPLLSGVIRGSKGSADVALRITSRMGQPVMNGTVTIPRLATTVDFTNVRYSLHDGRVEVKDNVFTMRGARLTDPGGNGAGMDATFDLARGFENYSYALHLRPEKMLVLGTTQADNDQFNGMVHASGTATIKGDKRGVAMDITATTAENSSFQMSLSSKSGFADADFVTFVSSRPVADSSYYRRRKQQILDRGDNAKNRNAASLNINMAINVLPNTEFQMVIDPSMGKGIKARGRGTLNIKVNPRTEEFLMYGDYELTEGSFNLNLQQILGRNFTIEPGSTIKWSGDPADATLDVTASYRVKASLGSLTGEGSAGEGSSGKGNPYANMNVTVDCKVILTGRLEKPDINFRVDLPEATPEIRNIVENSLNTPEMMSTQFMWLVLFNTFYSDNSGGSDIGTMAGYGTALDFAFGQISNLVSSDKVNFGLKYRPKDETNSDEWDISVSTSLVGNRVFLEIEGNYNRDNQTAEASGLTGDFTLRYLIDRTGNLQAKIFSRTINSYDENQGLQETGVGLYYYEDFNSFRDITRNLRSRFTKREKKNPPLRQDSTQSDNH